MEIIILVPKVISKPHFDLIDIDGSEKEMTEKEKTQLIDYENRLANWNKFADIVNAWPLMGEYTEVVNYKKAPIVIKDGEEYHLFSLPTARMNVGQEDVSEWLQTQADSPAWKLLNDIVAFISIIPIKESLKLMGFEFVK